MGTYNELRTTLRCPRCGCTGEMIVDLYFGHRDQARYALGDAYRWDGKRSIANGGRPPSGDLDGEGYTECPRCQKDFFVTVCVRSDRIVGASPDTTKAPLIPD